MKPYRSLFKEESGLDNYLNKFPSDTTKWSQATDELKDICRMAREFIGEYDNKQIKPLDFKSFKTPLSENDLNE